MHTNGDGSANYALCCNYAQRREWKLEQIRGYIYTGTMYAPIQGASEMEAKEMDCLKMLTQGGCEERTRGSGPANYCLIWIYAQRRKWKFAQFRGYI